MTETRELDALVAEYVMDFRRVRVPPDYDGKNAGETLVPPTFDAGAYAWAPKGAYTLFAFTPRYSTDLAAAWAVVAELERRGWSCCIATNACANGQQNGVKFFEGFRGIGYGIFDAAPRDGHHAVAETVPLAICRAALSVVGRTYAL